MKTQMYDSLQCTSTTSTCSHTNPVCTPGTHENEQTRNAQTGDAIKAHTTSHATPTGLHANHALGNTRTARATRLLCARSRNRTSSRMLLSVRLLNESLCSAQQKHPGGCPMSPHTTTHTCCGLARRHPHTPRATHHQTRRQDGHKGSTGVSMQPTPAMRGQIQP